jgi:Ca2+-binding EF-hand superfamily protein
LRLAGIRDFSTDEVKQLIRAVDADGTGDIDFAKFIALMAQQNGMALVR